MPEPTTPSSDLRRTIIFVVLVVVGVSFAVNILTLAGPIYMIQLYDRVLTSHSLPTLVGLTVIVFALFAFMTVLDAMRARILTRLGHYCSDALAALVYRHTVAPAHAAPRGHTPVQDLDRVRQFILSPGLPALFDMPWIPIYLGILFLFHSELGWLASIGALIISLFMVINELTSRKSSTLGEDRLIRRNAALSTAVANSETLTSMGMVAAMQERWSKLNGEFLGGQRSATDRTSFFASLVKGARFILQSAVLGYGAWLVIRQEVSPGVMIAASIVASRAIAPVEQFINHWRSFIAARGSLERLRRIVDDTGQSERLDLPLPSKTLSVTGLSVAAPGGTKPILHDISFQLTAGDGLGVVGPSGSGKSSLARAMVGVWPSIRGRVELDGHELSHWAAERRGRMIGYVPQDVRLLDGTIAQNIARFDEDAKAEDILAAAKLIGVHDLIANLPDGYDTEIRESGGNFSAGQRQRIALARAFYRTPFFIVLDEPNSDLDVEGERVLVEAVKTLRQRGSIVAFISHRQSALAAVNKVIVLDKGRVAKPEESKAAGQRAKAAPIVGKQ